MMYDNLREIVKKDKKVNSSKSKAVYDIGGVK